MTCSRPVRVSRSASARASSIVAGSRSTPSSVSMMHLGRVETLGQHVVHRELEVLGVDAEGEGQAGLRVEVDEQDLVAELGQGRPEGGHRGGLGDAALLVGDRECRCHRSLSCRTAVAEIATTPVCWSHVFNPRSSRHRPRHRAHGRDRPLVRRPAGPARARPGAGGPGRGAPRGAGGRAPDGVRRPRRGAARRPGGPGLARHGRGPAGRPGASGGAAGQQRRLRHEAAGSSTTRWTPRPRCSRCW